MVDTFLQLAPKNVIHITAMVRRRLTVICGLGALGVLIIASTPVYAACTEPAATARIVSIDNIVELKEAADSSFARASLKALVCQGDSIRVGAFSRATVAFLRSGLRLTIEQNTEWLVRQPAAPGRSLIELIRGAILFFTSQPQALDVQTPFVNAAVEGTEFLVRVEDNRAEVAVLEGTVALTNAAGQLDADGRPIGAGVGRAGSSASRHSTARCRALGALLRTDRPRIPSRSWTQVPAANRDAQFYVRRASVMLGVGRI